MNLHVLRTYESIAEAKELMSVSTQMISPQSNKPIIGLVQDSLVSVYLLTIKDTFLTRAQMMQMVMPVHYPLFDTLPPPAILKPRPLWTGKQLFSLLFPSFSLDVTVPAGVADGVDKKPDGHMDAAERRVIIQNGVLLAGALCKKTMGTSPGGIIHVVVKDCGNAVAARFISDAQRLLVEFMLHRGFSVGVGDCLMGGATHDKVVASINRSMAYADKLGSTEDTDARLLESCVTRVMTGVLTRVGSVVQEDLTRSNQVHIMVTSGAKGSSVNIAQILGCVGQQSVEGGRIAPDIYGRTLPCYSVGERTVESRGFVANSYGTGLTAQEYFFHAMGGREGLVDTAVKTASTGYIQRRLVKAEEGLQVRYDHTVRNTKDQVVQFAYGGDCFDAVFVEKQMLRTFGMSNAAVNEAYTFGEDVLRAALGVAPLDWSAWEAALEHEVQQLVADRDWIRGAKAHLTHAPSGQVFVTVTPTRILQRAVQRFGLHPRARSLFTHPTMVTSVLHQLYADIGRCRGNTTITLLYLRSMLSLKAVVLDYRLTPAALTWVADHILQTFRLSLVAPGEMVGTLGAASIGEPCTQMTLNTFHTAGVAEKAVTLGVPRLKELIDTTRDIRTPSLSVFFQGGYERHEAMARLYSVSLEHTVLHQVVKTSGVHEEPHLYSTAIDEDRDVVDAFRALYHDECEVEPEYVRWVIRFVLDREVLARKGLTVTHVANAIQAYMGDSVQTMRSEVNMMQWVVRLRIKDVSALLADVDEIDEVEREILKQAAVKTVHDFLLDNVSIGGVPGIKRTTVRQQEQVKWDAATGSMVSTREWMADTDGTGLRCVLALPFINRRKTISNDIHEILDVLGIEAAQQVLVEELRAVLSFDGSYVNERHLQLLVDVMCLSGTLTAMTRHSMHKLGGSTYHHASFEETQDVLIQAAAFGTYDHVTGVTENLMMGQLMPGGTGACDIIMPDVLPGPVNPVVKPLDLHTAVAPTTRVAPLFAPSASMANPVVKPLVKPMVVERPVAPLQAKSSKPLVKPGKSRGAHRAFVPLSPVMSAPTFVPLSPEVNMCSD
jgi:DNA-directed RNA polymerase II subunit RPB1